MMAGANVATRTRAGEARRLVGAALALHRSGQLAAAEPLYRQAIEADPDSAEPVQLLGTLALQAGRAGEAASLLERAA